MASLMSIAADFRGFIATSFPLIIDLLKDYNPGAREASVTVLLEFLSTVCVTSVMVSLTSSIADFHGFIATSLPKIIDLLKDNSKRVRCATVDMLSKLSEHGM